MREPRDADVQVAFCAALVDEWARAGVTDAVVAPGSRSTPLVLALAAEPRIRVHVVLDERSAGFVALGLGLAAGRPAVVATTSGPASVELHPAVVEAGQAGVPLIAVTTDRPPELHGVGAPQTVDQEGLFGSSPVWSCTPGPPDQTASAAWRSWGSRCVAEARSGPGPVHLNLAFREPLVGTADAPLVPPGRAVGEPWHRWEPATVPAPDSVVEVLASRSRGLVVAGAGSGDPATVLEAAARLGWVVLADPRSGCRLSTGPVIAAADALLRVPEVAGWEPDVVVRAGAPWASKVLSQWLAALPPTVPQVLADAGGRWADPERVASHAVACDGARLLSAAAGRSNREGDPEWCARWVAAEAAVQNTFDSELGPGGRYDLSEPAVARAVLAGLPEGGQLIVSSSMPVRDLEWYGAPRSDVTVFSNRGANGIDGVVSTAVGCALGLGRPTAALIGDLAFLYDAGALLWAIARDISLTLVVVNNDGGGIFSFLSQRTELAPALFERYWGTPHGVDLAAVAAVYGVEATTVKDRAGLDAVLARTGEPGVRVAVVPSERQANVSVHDELHASAAKAVRAQPAGPAT